MKDKITFVIKNTLRYGICVLILYYLYTYFQNNFKEFDLSLIELNSALLCVSLLFFALGYLLLVFVWSSMVRSIGGFSLPFLQSYIANTISWIGRYIPGKVWTPLGKIYLSVPSDPSDLGETNKRTEDQKSLVATLATLVTLETAMFVVAGITFAAIVTGSSITLPDSMYYSALTLCVLAIICFVKIGSFWKLLTRFLPKLPPVPKRLTLLKLFFSYVSVFALWGVAAVFLLLSLNPLPIQTAIQAAGVFAFSWIAGLVVLVAPAGVGVRETALFLGFEQLLLEPQIIIAFAALSRLITFAIEILFALSSLPFYFRNTKNRKIEKALEA